MNFFKSLYTFFNRQEIKSQEIDSTNNAIEFNWETHYTFVQCLWKIYPVFKQFGEIKNIKLFETKSSYPMRRLVIVEFITHQEAVAVLLKRRIKIEGHKITVEPCKKSSFEKFCSPEISQRVKVDDILLLQPPDKESPKNILNILNDDCLYEIFKRIHPSNYYLIAEVCVQFNRILKEMLARRHKNNMFLISDMQLFTLSEADHYLRYFGSSIYQAKVDGRKLKLANRLKIKIILKMISEHCVNLRHFCIIDFKMEKETVNEIIPLFLRLTKLRIVQTIGNFGQKYCPVFLPSINCPKLVAFEWSDKFWYMRTEQIPALKFFLYHNTQLKEFLYFGNAKKGRKNSTCHLPMNISLFGRFKSLECLSIINNSCLFKIVEQIDKQLLKVTNLMQELTIKNVPIKYLILGNTLVDDEAIEYISQIKTLKKFAFLDFNYNLIRSPTRDVIDSYIIRLESGLPNLEFLQFQTSDCYDIVFTDEHIDLIEKQLQKVILPEIKLNMQKFNGNAFTDKYNLTTIQNTYKKYLWCKLYWVYRVMIRKVSPTDLNVQRYWLTFSCIYEDPHVSTLKYHQYRTPIFGFAFTVRSCEPKNSIYPYQEK